MAVKVVLFFFFIYIYSKVIYSSVQTEYMLLETYYAYDEIRHIRCTHTLVYA